MKVLILAAGYATRLYPLTLETPKPLLEVGGKTLLDHILHKLRNIPVTEVCIITNAKFYGIFCAWANKQHASPMPITVINDLTTSNEDRLGAIGDIHFAVNQRDIHEDLLVIAGDNLFEFSLEQMHKEFLKKKATVVALYDLKEKSLLSNKFGVVQIDETGKIIDFEEKPAHPKSTLAATACYYFKYEDIQRIESYLLAGHRHDNSGDFIKHLVACSVVYGQIFTEPWYDIGSHEQLALARELYEKNNSKQSNN